MWHEVAKRDDIAPGGMKYVRAEDREICLCEYDGEIYAVSRRCGHQNAPLDQGSLEGWILTCPLHDGQFDIRSGKNLSWPLDHDMGDEAAIPEPVSGTSSSRRDCSGRPVCTTCTRTRRASSAAP